MQYRSESYGPMQPMKKKQFKGRTKEFLQDLEYCEVGSRGFNLKKQGLLNQLVKG